MALIQHSPLRVAHDTSVIYEPKRNQNITVKSYKKSDALATELTGWLINSFAVMKMSIPLQKGRFLKTKR